MSNINWGHLLFGFSGRINRAKWWLTILVTVIINVVVSVVANASQSETVIGVAGLIGFILGTWIYIAGGAKRLHDLNRTAAWLVLFICVPIVAAILLLASIGMTAFGLLLAGQTPDAETIARIGMNIVVAGLASGVVGIWALIWMGCLRGTVGPNQYGPDPLEGKL